MSHALVVSGGGHEGRLSAARDALHAHFSGDPEAVRKLDAGLFEDAITISPKEGKIVIVVDQIAELEEFLRQMPFSSTGRAGVIDDAGRMNEESQNKLLKLLEEPPPGVKIIMLAENPERLFPTVLSRSVIMHIGRLRPPAPPQEVAADVKEAVRVLLFGKGVMPDAWAVLSRHDADPQSAAAFAQALAFFLRDIAAGANDARLLPAESILDPSAAPRFDARQQRLARQFAQEAEGAARAIEGGIKARNALRRMALEMKRKAAEHA